MAKRRKKKSHMNIPMCIASVLFCLTLITIYMNGNLYARYATKASGSDGARVISFGELELTETGDFQENGKMMIIPGVDLTKKATLDFEGSEAATYVFVEAVLSSGWTSSDNRTFAIKNGSKTLMQWALESGWEFLETDNGSYVYYRELEPNTPLQEADIIANGGRITVSDQITKTEITTMTGISISLRAIAVQSSGFESPAAGWASVSAK